MHPNNVFQAHPWVRTACEAMAWLALAALVVLMALVAMQGRMVEVQVSLEVAAQLDASGRDLGAALMRMSLSPGMGGLGLGR